MVKKKKKNAPFHQFHVFPNETHFVAKHYDQPAAMWSALNEKNLKN